MDRLAYRLSSEENREIFKAIITVAQFNGLVMQVAPVAVFVGGQPGSGKTALQEAIKRNVSLDFSEVAKINGDDFRGYHPRFKQLNDSDDSLAAFYTDADAGAWVEQAIELVARTRSHMLIEGTMRNPEVTIGTAQRLLRAGYRNELHVVAAHGFFSRLRIFSRYLGQRALDGYGRYTLLAAHDASYGVLPDSLATIIGSDLFGRVVLYDIERNVLFDSAYDDEELQSSVAAILGYVRSDVRLPYDKLLADAQAMRRLALELGCNDMVLGDIKVLVDDLLTAARGVQSGISWRAGRS